MIEIIDTIDKFKTLEIEWNSLFHNANDVTFSKHLSIIGLLGRRLQPQMINFIL